MAIYFCKTKQKRRLPCGLKKYTPESCSVQSAASADCVSEGWNMRWTRGTESPAFSTASTSSNESAVLLAKAMARKYFDEALAQCEFGLTCINSTQPDHAAADIHSFTRCMISGVNAFSSLILINKLLIWKRQQH